MGIARTGLFGLLILLVACSSTETPVVRPVAQPSQAAPTAVLDPTALPEATAVPEPTAVPDPTALPEPTAVPDPTALPEASSTAPERGSGATSEPQDPSTVALPAFIEPPPSLTRLVGTADRGELDDRRIQAAGVVGGGAIINTGDDNADWSGLTWRTDGDQVSMAISSATGRNDDGSANWLVESVWLLQLAPDSLTTLGNDICSADERTHDYGQELFFVVTNKEYDTALGAWIITTQGPIPYEAFADLDCEEYFP